MDIPIPDPSDENYVKVISARKDAAISLVGMGLKADENRFKKRNNDVLAKLFLAMHQEGLLLEGQAKVIN